MNFIHIADVHLGAEPDAGTAYSKERPQELWDAFSRIIKVCEEEQTDILLIAGDLFHRQPLRRELKEADYLFSQLTHTRVVLIVGNHDYLKRGSFYQTFLFHENVRVLLGSELERTVFEDLDLAVYGSSFHEREIREPIYDNVKAPGRCRYEILLAHGGDEKHIPISRESLRNSGFDYIALGHIHKPQVLIENLAAYAGALEPTDRNDTGPHGYVKGEITKKGTRIEFVPFAKREYMHLALKVNETMTSGEVKNVIKSTVEKRGIQNLYQFILRGFRDPELVFDTAHMDVYGNILSVEDETQPAYNFEQLWKKNQNNLLGKYIEAFSGCEEGSVEYQALYAGVQALMENRR